MPKASKLLPRLILALCCVLLFILSYQLFYALCLRPSSDISIHATWAAEGDFRDITSFFHHGAHPMWHVLVTLVLFTGLPLPAAAALVTALCKVAEFALVCRLFSAAMKDRFSEWGVVLAGMVCVLVSSLCVPIYNPTVYGGVGTPNTWHSPTQMIAMVWMLLCVPVTAKCYDDFIEAEKHQGSRAMIKWPLPILLGVMLIASLTAKPTFMQAFLPAACLFFLVMWIRHPKNSRFFLQIILCVLPSVIFMILQYMYYFGIIVPSQGDMVLEMSWAKLINGLTAVVLIQAFPLYVLAANRKAEKDTFFWLAVIMNLVGVLEYLILGENGRRAGDGNFGWGMMGAALMLWVVTLPRFLVAMKTELAETHKLRSTFLTGLLLLGWHLASGIYYITYLFTSASPF